MTTLGDRIAAAKRHPADLTYSEWVELLEAVQQELRCDDGRPILGPATESYGSVEGTLEGLNLHASARYFTIYELLRGRSVRCHFAERIDTADIVAALERRVSVYGQVKYRRDGAEHSVVAEELHVFPDDGDIPPFDSLRGIGTPKSLEPPAPPSTRQDVESEARIGGWVPGIGSTHAGGAS